MELLRSAGVDPAGKEAVIVGRSNLVGRPLFSLLLGANATVTICHSRTRDLGEVCRRAEILVAAAGQPRLVSGDMIRPGATVIDVGTNRTDDGLVGDVDFDAAVEVAGAITPVPGGVGPMTIAMLLANTVQAARGRLTAARPGCLNPPRQIHRRRLTLDSSRLRTGEIVAGIGGVALFVFLFFDWFGGGAEVSGSLVNGTATLSHPGISGWDALTDLPGFLIILSGISGIALAYLAVGRPAGQHPAPARRGHRAAGRAGRAADPLADVRRLADAEDRRIPGPRLPRSPSPPAR